MNSIYVIHPYRWHDLWVFDDPAHGLVREPFVSGADTVIDLATAFIPDAEKGFNLLFSSSAFPSVHPDARLLILRLTNESPDKSGSTYVCDEFKISAWLCPAIYKYYVQAPPFLFAQFVQAQPKTKKTSCQKKPNHAQA